MSLGGYIRRNVFWANDRINEGVIWRQYCDLKQINEKGALNRQQSHLSLLLNHAVSYAEFYSGMKGNEITLFPVMNKQLIREHYKQLCIDTKHLPFQKGKIHIQRTSGSTGVPLAVPQDTRKRKRRVAELKYFGNIAGYKSHEKMAHLRIWTKWQHKSKFQAFYENIYPVDCSKIDEKMLLGLVDFIQQKKVRALWGYASWFGKLAEIVEKKSIKLPSLKVIIAGSEMLNPETRLKLSELLNCNVVSRYSNEEQGILGQDRTNDGHFYLNHGSYYFEFLKLDSDTPAQPGELSRIVVTDLFNYAFPMIRYDTGDTGIFEINRSNGLTVLSKIYGRRLDLVYDTSMVPVHPMALARILKNYDEIALWQFIQVDNGKYILKLKLNGELDVPECVSQLKAIFGTNVKIQVKLVKDIPNLASGKHKPVLNEWKK